MNREEARRNPRKSQSTDSVKQNRGRRGGNGTEIRLVQTRFGLRVFVKQRDNRVWLSERHIAIIFNAVLEKAFSSREENAASL